MISLHHHLKYLLLSTFIVFTSCAYADLRPLDLNKFSYPIYIGVTAGYGSTTWKQLAPKNDKQSAAISISTPSGATEGGVLWGVVIGYEIIPYFALEGAYQRFPNAKVFFDQTSLFTFDHDGLTELSTHTETASLMGKIMLIIPKTTIRAYSSAGIAGIHRYDEIFDRWRASPTFGFGLNYNFTPHWMAELGANYTAGYGESELRPAEDYVPFVYTIFLRGIYRF